MTGDDDKGQLNKPLFAPFPLLNSSTNFVNKVLAPTQQNVAQTHLLSSPCLPCRIFSLNLILGGFLSKLFTYIPIFIKKRTNLTDSLFDDLFAFLHASQA